MFSSSFIENAESAGRFQVAGKYKKNLDFTGTPETQPETPDSNFDIESSSSSDKRSRHIYSLSHDEKFDTYNLFSPIGHSSINLQRDYDAETDTDTDAIELHQGHLGDLTPVAEKSSKRRMIEALRAIARTPEKTHSDTYNTKKDFLSALRGVAVTPTKKETVLVSVSNGSTCTTPVDDRAPIMSGTSMEISYTSEEISFEDNVHSDKQYLSFDDKDAGRMHTPLKLPNGTSYSSNPIDATANVIQDHFSPAHISNNTTSSSPFDNQSFSTSYSNFNDSKEILTPSAKNSTDNFESDFTMEEGNAGTSNTLDNYWAAEQDYREALQEFEKEFAKTSYTTPCTKYGIEANVVKNVSLSVDTEDDGMYSVHWTSPSPFDGDVSSKTNDSKYDCSHAFVEDVDSVDRTDREDSTMFDDEQSDGEDATAIVGPSGDESLHDEEDSVQESPESLVTDDPSVLCETYEKASKDFMTIVKHSSFEVDTFALSPEREDSGFEKASSEDAKDMRNESRKDSIHDKMQIPISETKVSQSCTDDLLKSDSLQFQYQRPISKPIDGLDISKKSNDTPDDINASFASIDVNVGSKTPSESFARRQKFVFKADLPDVSPAKSDESASVTTSVASSVVTRKMSSVTASYLVSSDIVSNRMLRNDQTVNSTLTCEKSNISPNLLDKATLSRDLCSNLEGGRHSLDNAMDSTNSFSPNLLDKALLAPKEMDLEGSQHVSSGAYPMKSIKSSDHLRVQNKMKFSTSSNEQHADDVQNIHHVAEMKTSELRISQPLIEHDSAFPSFRDELPEDIQASRILNDAMKLNLGPILTKEILQSLLSANKENGLSTLGINHINIDPEGDDHSDISSLGTASIFSSTAFSTINAWIRNQPQERIENTVHDFNRSNQVNLAVEKTEQTMSSSPADDSFSAFNQRDILHSFLKPEARKIPFKLQPPRGDTQKSKRKGEMQKIEENADAPAVASNVLNDFTRLQEQLNSSKMVNRAYLAANRQIEREYDELQNEKLMNQFEQIEKLECQRRWNTAKKNEITRTSDSAVHTPRGNISVLSSNDWFVDTNASIEAEDNNEAFSSLLCAQPHNNTTDAIAAKKKLYELKGDDAIEDSISAENETIEQNIKKKKKVFRKMMKIIKRKKTPKNDEERSIGIASVTSMAISECQGKKKNRFKFLPSLRRKHKKENSKGEENRPIHDDDGVTDERMIINTMQIIDGMELCDIDDLDESFTTNSSDVSSGTSKGASCAYSSLP
jgi:hypothetical protein